MSDQTTVTHATFTIERVYPHPPERVFFANADKASKRRWYVEGEGFVVLEHGLDFRVGGEEISRFRYGEGPEIVFESQFQDIVPNRRIVFSYRMSMGTKRFSASLATIEIAPVPGGARYTFTEQGAYFDDPDAAKGREEGTRGLLESLAVELDRMA